MDEDSSNVSHSLQQKTADHCDHVSPGFVFDSKENLSDEEECEDSSKDTVSYYCRTVHKTRESQVACIEGAKVRFLPKCVVSDP